MSDVIVHWLDWDRSGEQICFEIERLIDLNHLKFDKKCIFRAEFNSLRPFAINEALRNWNSRPDKLKAKAEDAREEIDLRIGKSFSKQIKINFKNFKTLFNQEFSYGPCIFPTLWFCYERAKEIRDFVSDTYWNISIDFKSQDKKTHRISIKDIKWSTKKEAILKAKDIWERKLLKIVDQKKKKIVQPKPRPMDTETLLSLSSQRLMLDAKKTMDAAELLYQNGLISYPRTDSKEYEEGFDIEEHLGKFAEVEVYKVNALRLLNSGIRNQIEEDSDDDISAHTAIVPMPMFEYKKKSLEERKRFDAINLHKLIVWYFFATLAKDASITQVTIKYKVGDIEFENTHCERGELGHLQFLDLDPLFMKKVKLVQEQPPKQKEFEIVDIMVQKWQTAPLEYLSESELIKKMKENRIGTDATMHKYINRIQNKNLKYVEVKEDEFSKRFIPTQLGMALAEAFFGFDPDLIQPSIRRTIEENCLKITRGEKDHDELIEEVIGTFEGKLDILIQNKDKFVEHLKESGLKDNNLSKTADTSIYEKDAKRDIPGGDYLMESSTVADTDIESELSEEPEHHND
jgi:DNA topoisomerase III